MLAGPERHMRAVRFERLGAIALLVLSTAVISLPQAIATPTDTGVPMPDIADLPPPGPADIGLTAPSAPAAPAVAAPPAAAPPAASAPAPAQTAGPAALSPADQALADKIREAFANRADKPFADKKNRTAAEDFYKARNYAPVWFENGAATARAKAAVARLQQAENDGLNPGDYLTPDLAVLSAEAQTELQLTASLLDYARHAQAGRTTPSRLSPNIDVSPPVPEPVAVLAKVGEAADMAVALDDFSPPHEGYRKLKAKLAELRGAPEDRTVQIPSGPLLRKGKKDARVPLLRQRLHIEGAAEDLTYDPALFEAVKTFQRERGLTANGVLTQATVDALNGRSKARQIEAVVSNMERWRWLPRDLGPTYVMVNVPDFTLRMMNNGQNIFSTRIIVGKANTPSPVFSDEIENIVVNPSWHVPESIIYGEYGNLSSEALAARGYEVSYRRDGTMSIRQPPGERNALGRLKFNFPNHFQVYLHDTPTKHLFAQDRRAYSHGCMRVQHPEKFGEALLSAAMPQEGYSAQRLTKMYGRNEVTLKFKKTVPVHIVYMNAFIDEAGHLVVRDDVYGYDKRTQSALAGKYMTVAERSQKVTPGSSSQARRAHQARRRQVADNEPYGRDPRVPPQRRSAPRDDGGGFFMFPFFR